MLLHQRHILLLGCAFGNFKETIEGEGMAQEFADAFYHSSIWKKQRMIILKRDHFTCTEPGCHRRATEVHHIIELTKDNINDLNICLNENNLRSLCHDCHTRITKEMKADTHGVLPLITFDSNGYPIETAEKKSFTTQ